MSVIDGKYKKIRALGEGGQGQVFLAESVNGEGAQVAIKLLHRVDSQQARQRFEREIRSISSIEHNGIVKILDHNIESSEPYYVMPFIPGSKSLSKSAREQGNPYRGNAVKALDTIAKCADALTPVHAAKIVHRDLKPDNILVKPDGSICVIDFGCCLPMDHGESITLTDEGVGARNFMAPECEAGGTDEITGSADVYSLGKIMWCLIANEKPFAREQPGFRQKELSKMFPEQSEMGFITDILLRCIRSDPKQRFRTAEELCKKCRSTLSQIESGGRHVSGVLDTCHYCHSKNVINTAGNPRVQTKGVKLHFDVIQGQNNVHLQAVICVECGAISMADPAVRGVRTQQIENAG